MTSSCYRTVRHVVGTTLLFFGLSLGVSPDVRAEEPLAISEAPGEEAREDEESPDLSTVRTIAATSLGATGGMIGTYTTELMFCFALGGAWAALDCLENPVVLTVAVAGGVIGGRRGYSNKAFPIVFGGVSLGVFSASVPGYSNKWIPMLLGFVGSPALGYLGYRLWRTRESDGEQYSLLPYRDSERTGVILSGRF